MSLYSALRAGVSGLSAQTQAMAMISENISNVNTTGYKAVRARFSSLVGSTGSQATFSAGVVSAIAQRGVNEVGQVVASGNQTHMAINGQGFFAVAKAENIYQDSATGGWKNNGEVLFTRLGDFATDNNGNLANSAGYVLLGWARNSTNTGYDSTNLISEFTTINTAGSVGKPQPTQEIAMSANLDASLDEGESYIMNAPIYSKQGGVSTMEYKFTKIGTGNSDRSFRLEARVASGTVQLVNQSNGLTASAGRQIQEQGAAVATAEELEFYGAQIGSSNSEIILNYSGEVELSGNPVSNLKLEYEHESSFFQLDASTMTIAGGKVTVALGSQIPVDATNLRIYIDGANNPLQFSTRAATASEFAVLSTGAQAITIPAAGTASPAGGAQAADGNRISTFYEVGTISFDTEGLNPVLTASTGTAANGIYRTGTINDDGNLAIVVDHAADGLIDDDVSTDDVTVVTKFGQSGASSGMTSYVSTSTIYGISQDGNSSGNLQEVSVNSQGEVQAFFTRGTPRFLAQIPLMSFSNPNSLVAQNGNAYREGEASGVSVARVAGSVSTGIIAGGSLESSTADVATEFTEMIVVQRAYTASTKIITTVDEMLEDIIRAKR